MFRGGATATGFAAITGGNVEYVLAHTAIPLVLAPTGTMGNNGAVTLGTALATTYGQCYMLLPAGAIAAGVPAAADWYYCTMSSTTVGTVFNNTLSANVDANGMPMIPASPTAFATTGPGAFTGVTTATTALTLTLGAGAMGANGIYRLAMQLSIQAAGANRTTAVTFGGTSIHSSSFNNAAGSARIDAWVKNRNSASVQGAFSQLTASTSALTGVSATYAAVNTGAAVSVVIQITRPTATDTYALEEVTEWVKQQS